MKFLCSDMQTYWIKHIKEDENVSELVYEFVGNELCKLFDIPTPEVKQVKISLDSVQRDQIKMNKAIFTHNSSSFASKIVEHSNIVEKTSFLIKNKTDYNRILNPLDLAKIGLFDLQFANCDRYEDNFNLIYQMTAKKNKFYAIDHASLFLGKAYSNILKPVPEKHLAKNILKSNLYCNLKKNFSHHEIASISDDFFSKTDSVPEIINNLFETFPSDWRLNDLQKRLITFVTSEERNDSIKEIVYRQKILS